MDTEVPEVISTMSVMVKGEPEVCWVWTRVTEMVAVWVPTPRLETWRSQRIVPFPDPNILVDRRLTQLSGGLELDTFQPRPLRASPETVTVALPLGADPPTGTMVVWVGGVTERTSGDLKEAMHSASWSSSSSVTEPEVPLQPSVCPGPPHPKK